MAGSRGKSRIYIVTALLLVLFCAGFICPAKANAAVKTPVIKANLKTGKEYTKAKKLKLSIKNKRKSYCIRYTTNGKRPRYQSKKYRKPIAINKTTVIKAQVFKGRKKVSSVKKMKIKIKKTDPAPPVKTTWTMTQYGDMTGAQSMFYTLKSPEGIFIIIDGGWEGNTDYVRQVIKENGGVVHAWFLTHPHPDHIGAFNQIYANPQGIHIGQIYDNSLDMVYYDTVDKEWDGIETYRRYLALIQNASNVTHLHGGENLRFGSFQVEVLHAYNESLKMLTNDICNDSGLVLKFTGQQDSILFCADNHSPKIGEHLINTWGDKLKARYVQTGHHGNNSLPTDFYDFVNPQIVFFDAPQWLLDGETYTTKDLLNYFQIRGIPTYSYLSAPNIFEIL